MLLHPSCFQVLVVLATFELLMRRDERLFRRVLGHNSRRYLSVHLRRTVSRVHAWGNSTISSIYGRHIIGGDTVLVAHGWLIALISTELTDWFLVYRLQ